MVGPSSVLSSSVPFFTFGGEFAEVCKFLRDLLERMTRRGVVKTFTEELCQNWRGPDLVQDALPALLIARISKKTKGPLQLLDLRAGCSEWGSPNEVIVH